MLSEAEWQEALDRVKEQPRRERNGYVCIGGIGPHGECYGHGPRIDRDKWCPYCITPAGRKALEKEQADG